MYTAEQRARICAELLERAAADPRLTAGAITGSTASGSEDDWSDIDLAFGVSPNADVHTVLADWTAHLYEHHAAAHHTDVKFGAWIYRVFLLPDTLQIDLAFTPASEFRALAPAFRLVFGQTNDPREFPQPSPEGLIGLAWLHALHARSAIARGRYWQAEYMISGVRDHTLALACLRHNLPAVHARGIDHLPREVTAPLEASLVNRRDEAELARAFSIVIAGLLSEIESVDPKLAEQLRNPLTSLSTHHTSEHQ